MELRARIWQKAGVHSVNLIWFLPDFLQALVVVVVVVVEGFLEGP
jgi:hypothetical protein